MTFVKALPEVCSVLSVPCWAEGQGWPSVVFYPVTHSSLLQVSACRLVGFKLTHRALNVKEADRAVAYSGGDVINR